jgi:hypothetical protein
MAIRKLSLSLFSAKTRVSQPDGSTLYFHLVSSVRQSTNQYALVCELVPIEFHSCPRLPWRKEMKRNGGEA